MAARGRARGEKKMVAESGPDFLRGGRGGRRDEAVDDNRHPRSRTTEAYTRHRGDFEAAERSQRCDAIAGCRAMEAQSRFYNLAFPPQAGIVDPGPAPRWPSRAAPGHGC